MHPPEVRAEALRLVAEGLNDCEISRRMGVPRTTIRDWRRPVYVGQGGPLRMATCWRCWRPSRPQRFTFADYAELLGLYLGDGSISRHPRAYRLRITLDARYPNVVDEAGALVARVFGSNRCGRVVRRDGAVDLSVYSAHLPCLLPQHGPGKKHLRPIRLELWQLAIVAACPWPFIRGCIRSDGCVFVNRTGPYKYLSYHFGNMSKDITAYLAFALGSVDIEYRMTSGSRRGLHEIRINRRASVAVMLEHVGVKS